MTGISEDAASVAAAAANVAISQTVSAMLDSATTSAAQASAAPAMPEEISTLDADSIVAAGIAETVSTMLESATTAAVAATQEQEHQTAVAPERVSASAAATSFVPPLSPPGSTLEHSSIDIELSDRRSHDHESGSEIDELRITDGATANIADSSQDSRGQLGPVIVSDAGRLVYNEAAAKNKNNGGVQEYKAEEHDNDEARQERKDTTKNMDGKDEEEHEEQKEERLELPDDCDDRAAPSARALDSNNHMTDRSKGSKNAVEVVTGHSGRVERQQSGGRANDKSEAAGESSTTPNARPSAATAPHISPAQLGEGEGELKEQWQWWDDENPWARGPRPSTDRKPTGKKIPDMAPPPPVYQETTPPPPYQEVVSGLRMPRSSVQEHIVEQEEVAPFRRALRPVSAVSNDASGSSGDDTSRGPPPSYRAAAVGGKGSFSSSSDREEKHSTGHLPPPSYGRFYDESRSATFTSPLQGETNSSGTKSDGGEWWTQRDQHNPHGPVWSREGRGQERDRERRRTRVPSGGTGGGVSGGLQKYDRPETIGDEHEEERLGGKSWRRRQRSEGRRRRAVTTGGSSQPRTILPLPRGKSGHKDTTLRSALLAVDSRPTAKLEGNTEAVDVY